MLKRFQSFVSGITICYKYIQRIKSVEMTEFGLKGTHVMCLYFLRQNPEGLTAAQLCQLCMEDKAAISRTLAVLNEKEYISTEGKKYRASIRLTEKGIDVTDKIELLIGEWVGCGGDGLSEEDRETFYRSLEHISSNLHARLDEYDN